MSETERAPVTPLWIAADVETFLGVKTTTVYAYMKRTEDPLPSFRIGGSRRFDPAAVKAWATRQS